MILTDAAEVIERYSLDAEAYARIARNFLVQVDQAIASLQNWGVDSPPSEQGSVYPHRGKRHPTRGGTFGGGHGRSLFRLWVCANDSSLNAQT